MSSISAVQAYYTRVSSKKSTKLDEYRQVALSEVVDAALLLQMKRPDEWKRPISNLDNTLSFIKFLGFELTTRHESTINQCRFRNFTLKLHEDYAALLSDIYTFIKSYK